MIVARTNISKPHFVKNVYSTYTKGDVPCNSNSNIISNIEGAVLRSEEAIILAKACRVALVLPLSCFLLLLPNFIHSDALKMHCGNGLTGREYCTRNT